MKIRIKDGSVTVEGYVNAVERDSRVLRGAKERFIEKIRAGAFRRSLSRRKDVDVLLNHEPWRKVADTASGTATLKEDNIGLWCRAEITDPEVVDLAKEEKLSGWSFGFNPLKVENSEKDGISHREIEDLDLIEVSILDSTKTPAYPATMIMTRDDMEDIELELRDMEDDVEYKNANPDGVADRSDDESGTGDPVDSNYSFRNRLTRAKIRK